MASFSIQWKKGAEKDLRNIQAEVIPRIIDAVEKLKDNPHPRGRRKLLGSQRNYRIRIGDHRVIYRVDKDSGTIIIFRVRHRREAYQNIDS